MIPVPGAVRVCLARVEREADYGVGIVALIDRVLGLRLRFDIGGGRIGIVRPGGDLAEGVDTLNATLRAL